MDLTTVLQLISEKVSMKNYTKLLVKDKRSLTIGTKIAIMSI